MKIDAVSDQPQKLLDTINKAIEEDVLKTWKKLFNDKKEPLYSHTPDQWNEKAMIKPYLLDNKVSFRISWWTKNGEPSNEIKGYILGRFVEVLMVHFQNHFRYLEITK